MSPNEDAHRYFPPLLYTAAAADDGRELKQVARDRLGVSSRLLVRLKTTERGISVNGERARTSDRVREGDVIALRLERERSIDIWPQPLDLDIVFEDEHLIVVNKPAGLIVHPTTGHYANTLANGIVHYWQERGETARFHPVHRLDEHTSGLVVVAKHPYAHQQLAEAMERDAVDKRYRAYVFGRPPHAAGVIEAPIGRADDDPHRRIVREDGAAALTYYELASAYACGASALDIRLGTGRTHQIRVHALHIGCPLIGDDYYDAEPWRSAPWARALSGVVGRQALHAVRLAFPHPISKMTMSLEAALPADLQALERALSEMTAT